MIHWIFKPFCIFRIASACESLNCMKCACVQKKNKKSIILARASHYDHQNLWLYTPRNNNSCTPIQWVTRAMVVNLMSPRQQMYFIVYIMCLKSRKWCQYFRSSNVAVHALRHFTPLCHNDMCNQSYSMTPEQICKNFNETYRSFNDSWIIMAPVTCGWIYCQEFHKVDDTKLLQGNVIRCTDTVRENIKRYRRLSLRAFGVGRLSVSAWQDALQDLSILIYRV